MSGNVPIFTREELKLFWYEVKSKFRGGIRSSANFLYVSLTLGGVAWVSWGIPALNRSELSPEILGIYVSAFLISVMLDALVTWKKKNDDNPLEQTIAVLAFVISFFLLIASCVLSLKTFSHIDLLAPGEWKAHAYPFLYTILFIAVAMSIIVTGIDQKALSIGPLDAPENAVTDRGA